MSLRDLYEQYAERVHFLLIYIREAHPLDGWNIGSKNEFYDPKTIAERREIAAMCEVAMQYGIRTYVDEMDDAVMTAYAAWPERLYLLDSEGRVAYVSGIGPAGFKPAELKEAIDGLLDESKDA